MTRGKMLIGGLVVAIVGLAILSVFSGDKGFAQQVSQQLKIGVVNLQACAEKYEGLKDIQSNIENLYKEDAKKLEEIKKRMDSLDAQYKEARKAGLKRTLEEKYKDYMKAKYEYDLGQKMSEAKLLDMRAEYQVRLYDDIKDAIKKVCEEQAVSIVFKVDEPLDTDTKVDPVHSIAHRGILYADNGIDITVAVVKKLNEEYAKKKGSDGR